MMGQHFKVKLAKRALSEFMSGTDVPRKYFRSSGAKTVWDAGAVRHRLLDCLEHFFQWKHFSDSLKDNRANRDYLRQLFSDLSPGDIVVTLNWDSTAERTLAEMGLWNPFDGYGFEKTFVSGQRPATTPLPLGASKEKSAIQVFKLHGSVGWHLTSDRRIYFSNPCFLQRLDLHFNGKALNLTILSPHRMAPIERESLPTLPF